LWSRVKSWPLMLQDLPFLLLLSKDELKIKNRDLRSLKGAPLKIKQICASTSFLVPFTSGSVPYILKPLDYRTPPSTWSAYTHIRPSLGQIRVYIMGMNISSQLGKARSIRPICWPLIEPEPIQLHKVLSKIGAGCFNIRPSSSVNFRIFVLADYRYSSTSCLRDSLKFKPKFLDWFAEDKIQNFPRGSLPNRMIVSILLISYMNSYTTKMDWWIFPGELSSRKLLCKWAAGDQMIDYRIGREAIFAFLHRYWAIH